MGDLLTSYNGQAFTYDEIGNLTNDGTWAYTWKQGRQLAQMTQGATTWTYTYDDKGLRTQRTNGTETYNYICSGGLLRAMTVDGHSFIFRYGADGRPYSVQYDGVDYFYVLNAQGDVLAIVDGNGANAAVYTYNAWGNVMSSSSGALAQYNPLRYRGYVYDQETELYYLQSRYYNPEWGRFINADGLIATGQGLTGYNMFAYCGNNPVNRKDASGQSWLLVAVFAIYTAVSTAFIIHEANRVEDERDSMPEPTSDITDTFTETLKANADTVKQTTKEEGIVESSLQFYNKVRNHGIWDLKQLKEYQGTFLFNDIVVQAQDIGNINFGYTGKALGLPDWVLLSGAGVAQMMAGTSNFSFIIASNGDDLRDQMFIMYGIMLYNEHNYGS